MWHASSQARWHWKYRRNVKPTYLVFQAIVAFNWLVSVSFRFLIQNFHQKITLLIWQNNNISNRFTKFHIPLLKSADKGISYPAFVRAHCRTQKHTHLPSYPSTAARTRTKTAWPLFFNSFRFICALIIVSYIQYMELNAVPPRTREQRMIRLIIVDMAPWMVNAYKVKIPFSFMMLNKYMWRMRILYAQAHTNREKAWNDAAAWLRPPGMALPNITHPITMRIDSYLICCRYSQTMSNLNHIILSVSIPLSPPHFRRLYACESAPMYLYYTSMLLFWDTSYVHFLANGANIKKRCSIHILRLYRKCWISVGSILWLSNGHSVAAATTTASGIKNGTIGKYLLCCTHQISQQNSENKNKNTAH